MKGLKEGTLLNILIKGSYVSKDDADAITQLAGTSDGSIIDILYERKLLTKDLLGQAIAEHYGVPYFDLNSNIPSEELIKKVNPVFAKKYNVIIAEESEDAITIVNDDPVLAEELVALFKDSIPDKEINYAYSLTEDIESLYIHLEKPLDQKFQDIINSSGNRASQIVDELVLNATRREASDIHMEPLEDMVLIRFRIDGVLVKVGTLGRDIYGNVLNRIKVLAGMRIDQYRQTQDGAIRYPINDNKVDIRVSIIPTLDGQKIVMRVLSRYAKTLSLEGLGLPLTAVDMIQKAYRKTFGMILTTGPTGSGKTTTLYSLLKLLNDDTKNITTIEDPVEYRIRGVNQIQVNEDAGITFAKGLRSIVRQDPNIILVGEIRDKETAEIAINAALTGHLVLSTFHANDASTVIPRLIDMGIEPFLLASTLNLIIGQRLVRKISPAYKVSRKYSLKDLEEYMPKPELYFSDTETLYEPKVSPSAFSDGYEGRIGVYELIEMNKELEELTLTFPSGTQIAKLAKKSGMSTLFEDGLNKVKNGTTSIEELTRVVPANEIDKS